jgi:hypothetical protein
MLCGPGAGHGHDVLTLTRGRAGHAVGAAVRVGLL